MESTILISGLPPGCLRELVAALPLPSPNVKLLASVGEPSSEFPQLEIGESAGGADACAQQLRASGVQASTLILGALATPVLSGLDRGCDALETAVTQNSLLPIRILSAFLPELLERQAGRIVLVSFDPASLRRPEDAAVRGSAKGIVTYLESLRPALGLRGIAATTLFVRLDSLADWNPQRSGPTIGGEIARLLAKPVRERTLRLR